MNFFTIARQILSLAVDAISAGLKLRREAREAKPKPSEAEQAVRAGRVAGKAAADEAKRRPRGQA